MLLPSAQLGVILLTFKSVILNITKFYLLDEVIRDWSGRQLLDVFINKCDFHESVIIYREVFCIFLEIVRGTRIKIFKKKKTKNFCWDFNIAPSF